MPTSITTIHLLYIGFSFLVMLYDLLCISIKRSTHGTLGPRLRQRLRRACWYWKIKLNHKRKRLCLGFSTIDSFELFKNKIGVELCRGRVAFEFLAYQLKATLLDDRYHVEYDGGSYNIPIEKQPCNYGGFRYFFHCPQCDKRMRILYCKKGKFLCRKCLNLCYFTQILRPSTRCLIMGGKIEKKLQSMAGDIDTKPPWMKNKTFEKLQDKHFDYYDIKYEEALRKELLEYYPHKKSSSHTIKLK